MSYEVILTQCAQDEIQEAHNWWAAHRSPREAHNWYSGLLQAMLTLDEP